MFKKAAEKWRDDSYLRNRYITDLLLDYCTLGLVRGRVLHDIYTSEGWAQLPMKFRQYWPLFSH